VDRRLERAIRRQPQPQPQPQPEPEPQPQPVLEAAPLNAPAPPPYGLDPTGDFSLADLRAEHLLALEQELDADPEAVMANARSFWDADISADELRDKLQKARAFVERSDRGAAVLESELAFEAAVPMPEGWGFEGYDAKNLPVLPMATGFETVADSLGYATAWAAAKLANALKPKPPFPQHGAGRTFVYEAPAGDATIGLFGDFGNGLVHSKYVAKHLRATPIDHLIYVGDVYYCGTSKEFATYVAPEIEPFLIGDTAPGKKVNVMMLNSNHEMYSKGYSYFSYIKYRLAKGAPQCQEGSYFALRFGDAFHGRFRDAGQAAWLRQRLLEGRARGALNVLVTANEPYEYGSARTTKLHGDLAPYMPMVDFWLWGNTHYCGLFDRTATLPVATCIGHGGYPYRRAEQHLDGDLYQAPCPATPLFLEARSRYHGTNIRSELGNNGYLLMHLDTGARKIGLTYMDWMKTPRYRAELGRDGAGRLAVLKGEEL
jgi:hypothetical protein